MENIDSLNADLNTAADTLSEKTNENSVRIRRVFSTVYVIFSFVGICSLGFHLKIWNAKLCVLFKAFVVDRCGCSHASLGSDWIPYVFMLIL